VNASRDLLFHGYIKNPELYLYSSLVGVAIFLVAAKMVYTMDYKIRAYL
jgi:ABC-type polysaccharide/polyol phosphate export permease